MALKRPYTTILMVMLALAGITINVSCRGKGRAEGDTNPDSIVTQRSLNLEITDSRNGTLSYRFTTPLMEEHGLAAEKYMEFPAGIKVVTYNDSTRAVESELTARYAKRIERLKLWEARGKVVAINAEGRRLETEQLFWDEGSNIVYSNVYSRITTRDGEVLEGSSFESNTDLTDFNFRNPVGYVMVDNSVIGQNGEGHPTDSTAVAVDSPSVDIPGGVTDGNAGGNPAATGENAAANRDAVAVDSVNVTQ